MKKERERRKERAITPSSLGPMKKKLNPAPTKHLHTMGVLQSTVESAC